MIEESLLKPMVEEPPVISSAPGPGNLPSDYKPNAIEQLVGVAARCVILMPTLAVRMFRALAIVANPRHIAQTPEGLFAVQSQSTKDVYQLSVDPASKRLRCTCQDHTVREQDFCKHVLAVRLYQALDEIEKNHLPHLIKEIKAAVGEDKRATNPYTVHF